jgi:hypothetical protein
LAILTGEESMNIALYAAAAITWLPGTFILPGETGTFANFWRANSSVSSSKPQISGGRSIVDSSSILPCFHFGFVRKPRA